MQPNLSYFVLSLHAGTDPGVYAQELMRTCEEIILDTSRAPISNPVELLCRGVKETNMSGSSSVLIANFKDQVCVYDTSKFLCVFL